MYTPAGKVISISIPSIEAITFLANISAIKPYSVAIALDIITDDALAAKSLHQAIEQCIAQPWAGRRKVCNYSGTIYTGQRRQFRPHHHMAIYADKPSRAKGELNCVHIEWRHYGLQSLRAIGIVRPSDLLGFHFPHYWRSHLPLYYLDLERYGRLASNRRTKQRRQKPAIQKCAEGDSYNRDLENGLAAYRAQSLHPHRTTRSLQQFIKNAGRGPYVQQIDMRHVIKTIEPFWKPNCAGNSKALPQPDGFDAHNRNKEYGGHLQLSTQRGG